METVKDKSHYSISKVIALKLVSIAGFVQISLLLAVIFNFSDLFTIVYFFINGIVMLYSLYTIFKD